LPVPPAWAGLNSETRNPKYETNSKGGKGEKPETARFGAVLGFWHLNLGFVSDLGFRVSDLGGRQQTVGGTEKMRPAIAAMPDWCCKKPASR
jgi:hypothetical protein